MVQISEGLLILELQFPRISEPVLQKWLQPGKIKLTIHYSLSMDLVWIKAATKVDFFFVL
jgi:hypothetical protein